MIVIYAEKPDMGTKIAAALDCIHLDNGANVSFANLPRYDRYIKSQRARDGMFKINWNGKETIVTWGYGHMCGLKQARDYNPDYKNWRNLPLPYIPEEYGLKLTCDNEDQYKRLYKWFHQAEYIVCATDDDREGDLIFDYLYRFMKCTRPFKRALFNKQSQEEFVKAFNDLKTSESRDGVINAGRARSVGDYIVGAGPTAAMTIKFPNSGILSVGRVQTATLQLIIDRENEIRKFVPKDYFVIKGQFTKQDKSAFYIGMRERIDKKEEADAVFKKLIDSDRIATVKKVEKKKGKKSRPHLYSLSSLQMDANKKYGYSLEETLQIAQSLYDKGLTTYPRTDSVHLPEDMVGEMYSSLKMLFTLDAYKELKKKGNIETSYYFDNDKVSSHYAIVTTTKKPFEMTKEESRIYDMIARSVICMVYDDAVILKTKIETEIQGETFKSSGMIVLEPAFYTVLGMPKEGALPDIEEGEKVTSKFAVEAKKTEPPSRYTDASLLNAMMTCGKMIEDEELKALMAHGPDGKPRGLGRPSTQASILKTLESRGYVKKKGKTIFPTEKGMAMMEKFPVRDLKSAVMTAEWERRLDDIEEGKDSYDSFVKDLEKSVIEWTNQILALEGELPSDATAIKCPLCGSRLRKFDWGYGCTGYKRGCRFSIGQVAHKKLTENQVKRLCEGQTIHVKGLTTKTGGVFETDIRLNPEGKTEFVRNN